VRQWREGIKQLRRLPLRRGALKAEYTHSWMNDVTKIYSQEGLKISAQAVVRIGTG
jgi:hypothetical protein